MMKLFFRTSLLLTVFAVSLPASAWACPNCYGAIADSEIAAGIRLAMLSLIAVTALVGTGVVMFASNVRKRTKMYEKSRSAIDENGDIIQRQSY